MVVFFFTLNTSISGSLLPHFSEIVVRLLSLLLLLRVTIYGTRGGAGSSANIIVLLNSHRISADTVFPEEEILVSKS